MSNGRWATGEKGVARVETSREQNRLTGLDPRCAVPRSEMISPRQISDAIPGFALRGRAARGRGEAAQAESMGRNASRRGFLSRCEAAIFELSRDAARFRGAKDASRASAQASPEQRVAPGADWSWPSSRSIRSKEPGDSTRGSGPWMGSVLGWTDVGCSWTSAAGASPSALILDWHSSSRRSWMVTLWCCLRPASTLRFSKSAPLQPASRQGPGARMGNWGCLASPGAWTGGSAAFWMSTAV